MIADAQRHTGDAMMPFIPDSAKLAGSKMQVEIE